MKHHLLMACPGSQLLPCHLHCHLMALSDVPHRGGCTAADPLPLDWEDCMSPVADEKPSCAEWGTSLHCHYVG
jgi:hypothetical protein